VSASRAAHHRPALLSTARCENMFPMLYIDPGESIPVKSAPRTNINSFPARTVGVLLGPDTYARNYR
jgi:hypothetical protein